MLVPVVFSFQSSEYYQKKGSWPEREEGPAWPSTAEGRQSGPDGTRASASSSLAVAAASSTLDDLSCRGRLPRLLLRPLLLPCELCLRNVTFAPVYRHTGQSGLKRKLHQLCSTCSRNSMEKMCFPSQRCYQPPNHTFYSHDSSLIVSQSKSYYNNPNLFSTSPAEPFTLF